MMRIALILALTGCSLGRYKTESCTQNSDCREAFGFGQVCGGSGYCEAAPAYARCTDSYPSGLLERPDDFQDTVVLGALFNHTTDTPNYQAADLAIQHARETSTLDGLDLALVHCTFGQDGAIDSLSESDAAVEAARYLVDVLGVPAIVGPNTSDESRAVYQALEGSGTLIVSPSASAPSLSDIDGTTKTDDNPGLFWRTTASDAIQGRVIAGDMLDRGVADLAMVFQTSSYAEELSAVVQAEVERGGVSVSLFPFANATALVGAQTSVGNSGADEVLMVSSLEDQAIQFINSLTGDSKYDGRGLFLTDATADQLFLDSSNDDRYCELRGTRPAIPSGPVFDFFAAAYRGQFDDDPENSVFTPYTYDATWLMIYGAAWAHYQEDSITGTGMARGLRKLSAPNGRALNVGPGSWDAIQGAFEAGDAVQLTGASSDLDFDSASEELALDIEIWLPIPGDAGFCVEQICDGEGTCKASGADCTALCP